MMTQLMELGLQPTTVFALRNFTIHAFVCSMLILECLFPPFISALQGSGQVKSLPWRLPSFHVPRTPKNIISLMAMRSGFWCGAVVPGTAAVLSTEKGQLVAVQWVLGASGCCEVGQTTPAHAKQKLCWGWLSPKKGREGPSQTLVVQVPSSLPGLCQHQHHSSHSRCLWLRQPLGHSPLQTSHQSVTWKIWVLLEPFFA